MLRLGTSLSFGFLVLPIHVMLAKSKRTTLCKHWRDVTTLSRINEWKICRGALLNIRYPHRLGRWIQKKTEIESTFEWESCGGRYRCRRPNRRACRYVCVCSLTQKLILKMNTKRLWCHFVSKTFNFLFCFLSDFSFSLFVFLLHLNKSKSNHNNNNSKSANWPTTYFGQFVGYFSHPRQRHNRTVAFCVCVFLKV